MKIKYTGPLGDGVDIADGQSPGPGETVVVDDALGAALLEQDGEWTPVDAAAKKARKQILAKRAENGLPVDDTEISDVDSDVAATESEEG